ncbi:MAG: hypothetical protein HBSAPP03_28910 [Phycisphaerae bacterium]|nr:MAG: hypothetical protein HBSAPP03_28910 [Phycisphaerae bacterium]
MLVELLEPAGPELARRWLAALLTVDRAARASLVAEIERRVAEAYPPPEGLPAEVTVHHPPVQRDGYIEEVTTTYVVGERKPAKRSTRPRKSKGA